MAWETIAEALVDQAHDLLEGHAGEDSEPQGGEQQGREGMQIAVLTTS